MASSRPWRLTVRESLRETQVSEDSVTSVLDIPSLVNPDRQRQIVERVLRQRGFSEDDDGQMSRRRGGTVTRIDPSSGVITVSASDQQDVDLDAVGDLPECSPCANRSRERVREGLRKSLRSSADQRQEELQRQTTDRLEKELVSLGCEMEAVANEVTSSALKAKARELGDIKSISQDDKGNMTIVIEVPM